MKDGRKTRGNVKNWEGKRKGTPRGGGDSVNKRTGGTDWKGIGWKRKTEEEIIGRDEERSSQRSRGAIDLLDWRINSLFHLSAQMCISVQVWEVTETQHRVSLYSYQLNIKTGVKRAPFLCLWCDPAALPASINGDCICSKPLLICTSDAPRVIPIPASCGQKRAETKTFRLDQRAHRAALEFDWFLSNNFYFSAFYLGSRRSLCWEELGHQTEVGVLPEQQKQKSLIIKDFLDDCFLNEFGVQTADNAAESKPSGEAGAEHYAETKVGSMRGLQNEWRIFLLLYCWASEHSAQASGQSGPGAPGVPRLKRLTLRGLKAFLLPGFLQKQNWRQRFQLPIAHHLQ